MRHSPPALTQQTFQRGLRSLTKRHAYFARIVERFGPPPMWERTPGFPTLLHIILEQQVSLASARAAFDRLLTVVSPLTPQQFLTLDDATLKAVGFSRQKTTYGRYLAQSILDGGLDLEALQQLDDAKAMSELVQIKGIGLWTANIYLLMALRRPDIWPSGDLALAVAAQAVMRRKTRPTSTELDSLSVAWKPWRAIAARLLWHDYLSRRAAGTKG
jgi:DNA-3-methyladenine glycosylase II